MKKEEKEKATADSWGILPVTGDSVTKEIDFDAFVKVINESGADIIGLQEIRNEGEGKDYTPQAETLAKKLGFNYYFAQALLIDGVNPYGNAILSRYPIVSAETIGIPDPETRGYEGYYETRCLLKAKIDVGEGLNVLVSHFGLNPDEQDNAVSTVVPAVTSEKCILMGDFNMQPNNKILDPIRQLLNDTADNFAEPKLSFPSYAPKEKIDYISVSKDIDVISADIPDIVVSDHKPHIAVVEI